MKVLTDEVIASFKDAARKLTGPRAGVPGPSDAGLLGRNLSPNSSPAKVGLGPPTA